MTRQTRYSPEVRARAVPMVLEHRGERGWGDGVAAGTRLRHHHGRQFVADDFQRELGVLGLERSPAFVREPEGEGCIEELRRTPRAFKDAYEQGWILQR